MPERLEATVRRIRFHSSESGFTVMTATRHDTRAELTIVGSFPLVDEDEPIVAVGEWREDKKWGRQFVAESLSILIPTSREGIERYLSAGHVKGIGHALAKRLLEQFGTALLDVIDREPDRLLEIPGIGKGTLKKITGSWNEQRGVRELMVFLAQHRLGGARAFRIHKQYGDAAIAVIRDNPYRLAAEVRGIGFQTADTIARGMGFDLRSPARVLAGLRHVVEEARVGGHCGIPVTEAIANATKLLGVGAELVEDAIRAALFGGELVSEALRGQQVLFQPPLHRAEQRIALTLQALAKEEPPWPEIDADEAMAEAEADAAIVLDEQQREAIRTVLRSKVAVITGGPGVGKTTLVNAMLTIFRTMELEVLLAAPTGRAAKRLSESTGALATTIHRLLEMSGDSGTFQRNEERRLECDLLIVDETSMVDVPLMDALLRALPEHAGLVLVGDADQLPSIGPGQVLHDILASARVPSVRLTKIHRQAEGSDIIVNAHTINRGEVPRFRGAGEPSDMFFFPAASSEQAVQHVVDLVTEKLPRKFKLRPKDIQILAPMRNGTVGVHALNETLQRVLNDPTRYGARISRPNDVVFVPNDKVMQTENNYDKNVFNGDVGIITTIDMEEEIFRVDYGGENDVEYSFDEADQLTLAYATTIHKSQGSEYPAVIVTLLPQHHIMLQRNLLYTAVTRGRKVVVVVGDRRSMADAVRNGRGGERWTRLRELLVSG